MKRIITNITGGLLLAVCIVPTLLSVVSCGQQAADRDIAAADSLSEAAPQRAMTLIDSLEGESAMNKSRHMKLLLLKAKVRNKLAMPMSTDSLKDIADYFDKHGDSNERMLAYYILGCVYQRSQDAPMALQYFHEAAAKADTTDSSCDFLTLHRIHAWSAEILKSQFAFSDAFHENSLAFKYAMKAKDTLNAIITYEQKSNIYNALGLSDSAIFIRKKLYGLYSKYGYEKEAVRSLGLLINYGVENKELSDVKHYINLYEHKSGNFNDKGDIKKGVEIYYVAKGRYLAEINELDSAEYYFRKCARTAKNYSDLKYCFDDLADIYRKRNRPDSVAKYADLARMMTDSAYAQMSTEHLQQMQAMYNYNRYRQTAEEAEKDALRTKYISIIIIMAIMAAAIGGALAVRTYIMRKCRARVNEIKEYKRSISELKKARRELDILTENRQTRMESLIKEKEEEIERLQKEKVEYEKKKDIAARIMPFADEPVVRILRRHAEKEHVMMSGEERKMLISLFDSYEEISRLKAVLSESEYELCLLIKLGFAPSQINMLTGRSLQDIANIRKRMYNRITGKDGSSRDFDRYIKSL